MQSESLEKSDYSFEPDAENGQFKFRVLLGEFCLFKRVFNGQVIKPNVISSEASKGPEALFRPRGSEPAHIVSAPGSDDIDTGIQTNGKHVFYTYKVYNRMFVDVSGDYEEYLAGFRKKSLSSLNRKIRKAEKSNSEVDYIQCFRKPSDVAEFVRLAKPISAQSYQEAQLGTVFRTDDEWIAELETQARNNRFRGYILNIDNQPVAYNYCPVYGEGIMLYDLSGYLPDSSKHSPGTVLQAYIIKEAFADSTINFYDLCEGEGRHKEQFATGSKTCFNTYIFPNALHYRLLVTAHRTLDRLSDSIVAVLSRLGVKDRIKTFLRRSG
jgi:hypothetical protein